MVLTLRLSAVILSFVLWTTPAWADATLSYDGPWQISVFGSDFGLGFASLRQVSGLLFTTAQFTFTNPDGTTSTFDGPVAAFPPPPPPSLGSLDNFIGTSLVEELSVSGEWISGSFGVGIRMTASRAFTLSNAPNGLSVVIGGLLTGEQHAAFPCICGGGGSSGTSAFLGIDGRGVDLGDSISADGPIVGIKSETVLISGDRLLILSDGPHLLNLSFNGGAQGAGGGSATFASRLSFDPIAVGTPLPEPSTWLLLGSGLVALGFVRRKLAV